MTIVASWQAGNAWQGQCWTIVTHDKDNAADVSQCLCTQIRLVAQIGKCLSTTNYDWKAFRSALPSLASDCHINELCHDTENCNFSETMVITKFMDFGAGAHTSPSRMWWARFHRDQSLHVHARYLTSGTKLLMHIWNINTMLWLFCLMKCVTTLCYYTLFGALLESLGLSCGQYE